MIGQHKYNTPWQEYENIIFDEAYIIFNKCLNEIEAGHYSPSAMFRNGRGYVQMYSTGSPPSYLSLWGMILHQWVPLSAYPHAEATLEFIISVLGSEANKMQYTSPRMVEIKLGKHGVIELLSRSANLTRAIHMEEQLRYYDTEQGRGISIVHDIPQEKAPTRNEEEGGTEEGEFRSED